MRTVVHPSRAVNRAVYGTDDEPEDVDLVGHVQVDHGAESSSLFDRRVVLGLGLGVENKDGVAFGARRLVAERCQQILAPVAPKAELDAGDNRVRVLSA